MPLSSPVTPGGRTETKKKKITIRKKNTPNQKPNLDASKGSYEEYVSFRRSQRHNLD